ncbi:MAG: tetratricopeptide repeat protein, partial [Methylocella sp.]
LIRVVETRLTALSTVESVDRALTQEEGAEDSHGLDSFDPITAAVERAVAHYKRDKRGRPPMGGYEDLPGIQLQIKWIGERLKRGETERAEKAAVELIDRQSKRSRPKDIVKTLTAIADHGRTARLFDWTWRLLTAIDHLGVPDAGALCVRAETLRDLGRTGEALASLEATMERFPDDVVARTAYADLLAELGRIKEAEAVLAPAAEQLCTAHDWISAHILAMAYLRDGRAKDALARLEHGARFCPHFQQRKYFVTALPLAMLADQRAAEAARHFEAIAKDATLSLSRREMVNVVLFEAHAFAEAGEKQRAQALLESPQVIDLAAYKQKRLATAIAERYSLGGLPPAPDSVVHRLNENIVTLEFELVRPNAKLRSHGASLRRAA